MKNTTDRVHQDWANTAGAPTIIKNHKGKIIKVFKPKRAKCPHSNCDDDGNCHKCGKSAISSKIIN